MPNYYKIMDLVNRFSKMFNMNQYPKSSQLTFDAMDNSDMVCKVRTYFDNQNNGWIPEPNLNDVWWHPDARLYVHFDIVCGTLTIG